MPTPHTTKQRGYGHTHRAARTAALTRLRDGDPCARCGQPMYRSQQLDLDHTDDRTAYRGLTHRRCNRSAGASKGNRMRRTVNTIGQRTDHAW